MSVPWEQIDHISTLVIAAATFVGYLTLRQSQQALRADEHRRKLITAIEQNQRFTSELVPRQTSLTDRYAAERLANLITPGDASPLVLSVELLDEAKIFANMMESWALYVLEGLADEALLLRVSGTAFCEQVPALTTHTGLSVADAHRAWRPVYQLYNRWLPQLTEEPKVLVATRVRL